MVLGLRSQIDQLRSEIVPFGWRFPVLSLRLSQPAFFHHSAIECITMSRTDPGERRKLPSEAKDSPRSGGSSGSQSDSLGDRQAMMRLASAGFELASFSLILGGAGYGVDHFMGNGTPYVAIAGLLLGFSLGFYRLIVLANRLS